MCIMTLYLQKPLERTLNIVNIHFNIIMKKNIMDRVKLDQSKAWLRQTGAKNKIQALVFVDPELKDFVDQSLVVGKSPTTIAVDLARKMKEMGTDDWQIPSFLAIQNYRDRDFSQTEYCAGVIINKSIELKRLSNIVRERIDTSIMVGKVMFDLFETIERTVLAEKETGLLTKTGLEARKTFCELVATYEAQKKNTPDFSHIPNVIGSVNIQNNFPDNLPSDEEIKASLDEARQVMADIERIYEEGGKVKRNRKPKPTETI